MSWNRSDELIVRKEPFLYFTFAAHILALAVHLVVFEPTDVVATVLENQATVAMELVEGELSLVNVVGARDAAADAVELCRAGCELTGPIPILVLDLFVLNVLAIELDPSVRLARYFINGKRLQLLPCFQ